MIISKALIKFNLLFVSKGERRKIVENGLCKRSGSVEHYRLNIDEIFENNLQPVGEAA